MAVLAQEVNRLDSTAKVELLATARGLHSQAATKGALSIHALFDDHWVDVGPGPQNESIAVVASEAIFGNAAKTAVADPEPLRPRSDCDPLGFREIVGATCGDHGPA